MADLGQLPGADRVHRVPEPVVIPRRRRVPGQPVRRGGPPPVSPFEVRPTSPMPRPRRSPAGIRQCLHFGRGAHIVLGSVLRSTRGICRGYRNVLPRSSSDTASPHYRSSTPARIRSSIETVRHHERRARPARGRTRKNRDRRRFGRGDVGTGEMLVVGDVVDGSDSVGPSDDVAGAVTGIWLAGG